MRIFPAVLCLLFLATANALFAAGDVKIVTLAETPAAVQKNIATQVGDGTVQEIDRTTENGETVFEVDFAAKGGDEHDFTVADDGTLLSTGVALADTPAAVQKTIQAQLLGWQITGINKNLADTDISYDVTVAKDGREKNFNVDNAGTLSSTEVTLMDTPPAVQAIINTQIAGGSLRTIDENFDAEGNSFDIEAVAKEGGRKTFSVALDGRLLSEGVTLEQVPPVARRTITEKIGDGKILEIDRSLSEKKAGVLPYEVQGRKAGREFDFSVGPRGRFLGMDE